MVHLDGSIGVQYCMAPVGIPQRSGWMLCDPTSTAATSSLSGTSALGAAQTLPFKAQLATRAGAAEDALLTSEDGVTLGLKLASVNGFAPGAVTGQNSGSQESFPGVVAVGNRLPTATVTPTSATSGSTVPLPALVTPGLSSAVASAPVDYALRQTVSGLHARVTLHSSAQGGSIIFTLSPDGSASVVQDAQGRIIASVRQAGRRLLDSAEPGVSCVGAAFPAAVVDTAAAGGALAVASAGAQPSPRSRSALEALLARHDDRYPSPIPPELHQALP